MKEILAKSVSFHGPTVESGKVANVFTSVTRLEISLRKPPTKIGNKLLWKPQFKERATINSGD